MMLSRTRRGGRCRGGSPAALRAALALFAGGVLLLPGLWSPLAAGVLFRDCVSGSDGSITCDTQPTGNTLFDDEAARFGLLNNASPGWSEFDPYAGYDGEFGGGED